MHSIARLSLIETKIVHVAIDTFLMKTYCYRLLTRYKKSTLSVEQKSYGVGKTWGQ